jgi:hypothetical protein
MGTAYTPGLKVSEGAIISKTRRLPIKGEIAVSVGDEVKPQDIVARAFLPGELHAVKVAEKMGLEPVEVEESILVKKGDSVKAGEILAKKKTFFGLLTAQCASPVDGTVEYYAPATGHLGIRERPRLLEINAYISGKVSQVMPQEGVVVTTYGTLIQGIFGVGGERQGVIQRVCSSPDEPFTPDRIPSQVEEKILVGGSIVTSDVLRKLSQMGARGVVVGGIVDEELTAFLGYEIGIAITGQEDIGLTLIVTEGFGKMDMAEITFRLLWKLEGKEASINGATQIRAGALRPEVIVPLRSPRDSDRESEREVSSSQLNIGSAVRIIRFPYFGKLATVVSLPPEPREIQTGSKVRMLEAKLLETGETVSVPRANVEIIEGEQTPR